tara:strand:- start:3592 stop:3867 length:276 start_codon:yes stop_codon:yes gene_type:complete
MEHKFRVGLKARPTIENESFAFNGGSQSYRPHPPYENQHLQCYQFDATKLRDFMELQSHEQKDSLEQQGQSMLYDVTSVGSNHGPMKKIRH